MTPDTPPQDLTAERAVLGAVLLAGAPLLETLDDTGLRPGDFYDPRHETIYDTMRDLHATRAPIDAVTVAAALGTNLGLIGGHAALHDLVQACVSPHSAGHYAAIVARTATLRRLTAAGARITQLGHTDGDAHELVDTAQAELAAVSDRLTGRTTSTMGEALDDLLSLIETGDTPATPTGITDLDRLLVGGLRPGTLTTIAARPGGGKTVIALQIALNIALHGGNVGYSTLEMTRTDLLMRALSSLARVDYGRLQRSPAQPLTDREWAAIRRATETIRDSGLTISDRTKTTVPEIRADIRHMIRTKGSCAAWVVDYLQLITPTDSRVIREQQVAGMTRTLKLAALETGTPIILVAQLNREGARSDRLPVLTDLRESGSIEQDSDNVVLLHRADNTPDILAVSVAKNRRGPQGAFDLTFEGSYQRVTEKPWTPHSNL